MELRDASSPPVESKPEPGRKTQEPCELSIERTIEAEIIPRLMLVHGALPQAPVKDTTHWTVPSEREISELARLCAHRPLQSAREFFDGVLARGVPLDVAFLELLAPAARLLGEMWLADLCSFADVTIGLSRLQTLLHERGSGFSARASGSVEQRIAVLLPAPGEQHTLGLHIVAECFRQAGWTALTEVSEGAELLALVKAQWIDMVGFSVSDPNLISPLIEEIRSIRAASRNREVVVLLGGTLVSSSPDLPDYLRRSGADACAATALDAVQFMQRRLEGTAGRRAH